LGLVGRDGVATTPGGGLATVLVAIDPPDHRAEEEAVAALRGLAADPPAGVSARVVGLPVLDLALNDSSREIGRVFFPLLAGLAVVLLAVSFRDPRGVVVPLVFVAVPEVILLGALGYAGVELNLVLAVLPPLLFVIALATAVHLQIRFRDALEDGLEGAAAVRATYEDKGWAVLWTGVTTMAAFGSLAVSRVGPVPTLGAASAAGMALLTGAAFLLYPALLVMVGEPRARVLRSRAFEHRFRRLGRAWAERAAEHRHRVLAGAGVLMAGAALGLPGLRVESNAVTYLPPDHPAREGIEALEAHGVGVAAGELLLTVEAAEDDAGLARGDRLAATRRIAQRVRELPGVLGAVGPGDLVARAAAAGFGGSVVPGGSPPGGPPPAELLRAFLVPDGRAARITVFTPAAGHARIEPLFARIEALAREELPGVRATVTGQFPLVLETHRRLLVTLGLSLTLTLAAVAIIFRFLLPSNRLTLLALAPNLWPVVMVVGGMGWLGVPLDTATVMVASVVLGLAVDDTIHTLGHFRELAPVLGRREAVAGTLQRTAPAYVLTGVILSAGFGVCALSEFAPTARFGALSALAIGFAVAGDLVLLPALLGSTPREVVHRLGRRRGRARSGSASV
ncbi:MAG: efflux RND transporter permease subunit, partial [Thermoanaerobaculia bacterium]